MKLLGIWICFVFGLACLPALSQTFGEITGQVTDTSGAAVPNALITLTNISTSAIRTTQSTQSGDYSFPSLPPGLYRAKVERSGFKTESIPNVEVQVQQTVRLDFSLQVGQVSESVLVEASADQLQAENATVGTVIENRGIVELPLNGRQYLNLVALSPNTNTLSPAAGQAQSREGGDRANQSISTAGQRIFFDYFTLDGVSNTDPNFNSYVVLPSIDALQEFKIQTGVYPAEFGHEATQINVLTKSGGNRYHGSAFEFLRNDVLDAKPYSFTSRPQAKSPFKWNDYGFVLDGPVRIPKLFNGQNKLFFMANYEALRRRQNFQSVYTVPTPAEFTGDFSGLSKTIYDPLTKTPFPGNIIPANRIDPISKKLLQYYAAANVPGVLSNNFVRSSASPLNRDGFVLRMDYVESPKSQWAGRYSWGDENQANQGITLDGSKLVTNYEQYMGSNTRTFTPNIVNEARFGYTRLFNSIGTYLAFNTNVVDSLGIPGFTGGAPVTWGIPNVTLLNYSSIGDSTDGPYANSNNTLQFVDTMSWIKGSHTFRFGFEYTRQNYNQVGNQFSRGQFTFQPNATLGPNFTGGDTFADFLLGDMYQSEVAVGIANAQFQRNAFAAFIDDTWKVTRKLTVSLGLRYELTPPFLDTLGNLVTVYEPHIEFASNVDPSLYPVMMRQGNCTDPYAGINIRWPQIGFVCSNGVLDPQLMKTEYTDFAPRVGIAYSPNSKWVVRTGFGMFYNQDIGNSEYFDMARQIAGRIRVTNQVQGVPNIFWNNALAAVAGGAHANVTSPFAFEAAPSHRTPYTMEYLLNVQRQFGGNIVVETGYLGSISRHLYGFQDANQPPPGTTPLSSRLPFPNFGVIQLVQDGGVGHYNAGSIKVTKRFSAGLSFISSYTYAKSIDDTSGIRVQGYDTLYPQNSDCINPCERGLSSFDVRHRFVTSALYDIPVGRGRRVDLNNMFLNGVAGGWQIGGIWTVQSGLPQTITIGGVDRSNTGQGYDRPIATGVSPYEPNPTPSRWYNPAAFVEAPPGTFGNVGRNSVVGPGIFALDFDAHKEFRMPYSEQHTLQFRFEAFNVLNHPSWSNPNGNILSSGFGVITGTSVAMRQLQLGLKYFF